MNINKLLLAALLATAFVPAFAEEGAEPQPRMVERRIVLAPGAEGGAMIGDGVFAMHARAVKNAPYSAEVVTERVQTLADGNQITRSTSAMSYRDSAGRVRHEVRDQNGEVRTITIQDPVEKVTYVLHPKDKTATKIARGDGARFQALSGPARAAAESARAAAETARAHAEQLRKEGKLQTVERRQTADGEEIVIRRVQRTGEAGPSVAREARAQIGPMLANAFGDAQWKSKAVAKDLGTRDFDGVKAQGKQRTYEIPAGAIGNRSAIVVSDETWTSPELQVSVYTKHSDPRSGDFVYRLQNLKRDEPAAALFTVPSDYTVKDVLANIKRRIEEKKE
ncbi:MAG TPA: hypothetical protein VNT33_07740 [Telluria sp.]|nr:hypothetical protein [Telluria sp.]